MSRKPVVKKAIPLETKSLAEEIDGLLRAIETGVVDAQTINTLKRMLLPKPPPLASTNASSQSKFTSLASSKSKKTTRTIPPPPKKTLPQDPFPSSELVSATKTVVMKSLTALATAAEFESKKGVSDESTTTRQPVSQATRNISVCCRLALEVLRQWQDHVDVGTSWVNKAYFGYISKLVGLEMPDTAIKEITTLKGEIEKQLQVITPISKSSITSSKKKLQTSAKQNLPRPSNPPFNPLPLLVISAPDIDDEDSLLLICAYFNHLLRAIGVKQSYQADQAFISALNASDGPVFWINKLPSESSQNQVDQFSRAILKITLNSTSPPIQLTLRILRHRVLLSHDATQADSSAKSIFQALRSYYATTKAEKDAYIVCRDSFTSMLDQLVVTSEGGKLVNFMGVLARKAGFLGEARKWNDLGLRKCSKEDKLHNALFVLRNAAILFASSKGEIDGIGEDVLTDRLKFAKNCLERFEEFESSATEQLREELDYLRRTLLACPQDILDHNKLLQDARQYFPCRILRAILILTDLNPTLIAKVVGPARTLIFDVLNIIRTSFSPKSPPPHYLSTLDLCRKVAEKLQDPQCLQFTGNQYFNCGHAFYKTGSPKDARRLLEVSLELDYQAHHHAADESAEPEEKQRNVLARCRKLEMLGECHKRGEEKDSFALILEALNVLLSEGLGKTWGDEVAATMSVGQTMRKEEYMKKLVAVLTRFTKDQGEMSPGDKEMELDEEFSIILNDDVEVEVKALVYEIQVHVLLEMTHQGRYTTAKKVGQKALKIYSEANCPLRQARVIERLLYLAVVEGEDIDDSFTLGDNAIHTLTLTKGFGKDEGLVSFRKVLLARSLAWMALLSDQTTEPKHEYFSQALSIWTRWSEKVLPDPTPENREEMSEVVTILTLLSDFFEVKYLSLLRVQSLHLLLTLKSHLTKNLNEIIPIYASLAETYLRLGYTGKAGTLFAQGSKHMKDSQPSPSTLLPWHLTYAEYYARISNLTKANFHISQAGILYTSTFSSDRKWIEPAERAERVLAVGKAGFVLSLIAFEESELEKAIGYVDYAIRVLKTGIAAAERAGKVVTMATRDYDPFSSDPRPPVEEVRPKGIQFGCKLWSFKSVFFNAMLQHGVLLTFRGSARNGEFWFRQAYDAAKTMSARNAQLIATLHLGDLHTRMAALPIAHEFLNEAAEVADGVDKTKDSILMDLSFFGIHGRRELWSDAFRSILRAESKLKRLLDPAFVNGLEKGEGIDWVDRFANLRLSAGSPARSAAAKSPKLVRRRRQSRANSTVSRVEYESVVFSRMQVTIAERKGYSLARQRQFAEAYLALDSIGDLDRGGVENLSARITKSKMLLLEVHQLLASDPMLCVLSESVSMAKERGPKFPQLGSLLLEAQSLIESIFDQACVLCPSTLAQLVGLLMADAQLLSSVINEPEEDQNVLALKTIMLLDRSKSVNYRREQAALTYEANQEYISLKEVQWPEQRSPSDPNDDEELSTLLTTLTVSPQKKHETTFTAESLLNGIPAGCTVVSVHLSDSKEHFVLSKVQAQGCVVVRLPLLKHPPEADEEPFTFQSALAELTEIIELNNETAQAAKDVPDREAKEVWWNTRKELDARLALFLQNMETCWIGGFTGMFRGFFPNDDVFAKFRTNFRQILIKFLPSRRESEAQLDLDPRLVDLFLSLKSDRPEMDSDIADQVEDLICFALDNFKFHGEQIAIDEVDLDAMTIDIQEAIRCYHEAVSPRKQEHVILILDKALHMFPWESLPCLRGKSVSRLPSLGSLMERVVDSPSEGPSWPNVAANRGYFILNPDGDLTHTQSQFENTLAKIDGWKGIVGRAPMDQEMLWALRNNDVFLYFGHGSGEQYVKLTQIKKLPNCAVSMLFGCSSGRLRDVGDFEPWGTPFSYLLGGSPAMLANLWDVTDRDIDRLSNGIFSRWGLCDERPKSRGSDDGSFEPERGMGLDFGGPSLGERKRQLQASMKGKKKFIATRKGMSLTEALAAARDDCTLKYLNGAAPVIYGVPVFLREK